MEKRNIKRRMSDIQWETGFFDSKKNRCKMLYRSSYERIVFEILENDNDVIAYEYEPFGIYYRYHKKMRRYYPDILIHYQDKVKILVEIKAKWQIEKPTYFLRRKLSAGYAFARRHNFTFLIWTIEKGKIVELELPPEQIII